MSPIGRPPAGSRLRTQVALTAIAVLLALAVFLLASNAVQTVALPAIAIAYFVAIVALA